MGGKHFVYVYRSGEKVRYVGYGADSERALAHTDSHNDGLRSWIASNACEVTVAGPYRDEEEGRKIEAALISALRPQFNAVAGKGPKFVPIGVPPELSDRPTEPALTLIELGQRTGGALVVYLSPGDYLSDGRPKFDPADPADAIVQSNIQEAWEVGPHLDEWLDGDYSGPHVLVGVHGRVSIGSWRAPPASMCCAGATRACCASADAIAFRSSSPLTSTLANCAGGRCRTRSSDNSAGSGTSGWMAVAGCCTRHHR